MKIAFLLGGFPSLSETFILNQIVGLINRGHSISILACGRGDGEEVHEEVRDYQLMESTTYFTSMPAGKFDLLFKGALLFLACLVKSPRAALRLTFIRRNGGFKASIKLIYCAHGLLNGKAAFDIIYCHFGPMGINAVALREAGLLRGRIVTTFHGTEDAVLNGNAGRKVYRHLFHKGDWFLPVSKLWHRALIEIGAPVERTSVHHMGISTICAKNRGITANETKEVKLLSVCRLVEKKGLQYSLEALSIIMRESPVRVVFHIIGDGHLRTDLERQVARLGLDSLVHFHGERTREEVQEYLEHADIFLQPSVTAMSQGRLDREGIPVALMEAMAAGLPVVSTRHAGIPELVDDTVTGILVDEKNSRQLANALLRMVSDPISRREMGQAGRRMVQSKFDIEKLNTELEALFISLLGERASREKLVCTREGRNY